MHLINADGSPSPNQAALIGTTVGLFCVSTTISAFSFLRLVRMLISVTSQTGGCIGVLLTSWALDRFGRKPTMIALVAVYTLGGALVTAAQNIAMFIAARFIHGFAAISFIASSMSWISSHCQARKIHGLTRDSQHQPTLPSYPKPKPEAFSPDLRVWRSPVATQSLHSWVSPSLIRKIRTSSGEHPSVSASCPLQGFS